MDSICLLDGCYTISCDGGSSQSEIDWSLSSSNGVTLFLSGAPFSDTICFPVDCTPNLESFENLPLSWTNGVYNGFGQTTNLPWIRNQGVTPTAQTGPNAAFDGNWYMYLECAAFPPSSYATLTSECVDVSNFSNMYLSFAYHMYGVGIGSLKVEVSDDGGANWVTEWSKSGNNGSSWYEAHVDLSHYSSYIMVRFIGEVGIGTLGDIAVDYVRFQDPITGCLDPYAANYNPSAVVDDGSCDYSNCTQLILTMWDNFGDGWNGNIFRLTASDGTIFGLLLLNSFLMVLLVLLVFVFLTIVMQFFVVVEHGKMKCIGN